MPDVVESRPIATVLPIPAEGSAPACKQQGAIRFIAQSIRQVYSAAEWLFGVVTVIFGLAVLATLPVVQFLSLGYLLETSGRIARSGRLRDGFIGVRRAARVGSIVLGTWLVLLPLRLVASLAHSARIVDPDGEVARRWNVALLILTGLAAVHVAAAVSRGGRLRYFFWPFNPIWFLRRIRRGNYYAEARDAVWDFVTALRLPDYFWLGLRGFAGAMAWLLLPVTLLAIGSRAPVFALLGTLLLLLVLLYLPFFQAHFAAENRFRAFVELGAIRSLFKRAPWAFALAFAVTLLFALPLYLLKIEMIPREAAWLPSLVFITFTLPARLLTGWALGRARHSAEPRHWFFRWTGRISMLPVVGLYIVILFLMQYAAWEGVWSLYAQHAFLLPVPFLSM